MDSWKQRARQAVMDFNVDGLDRYKDGELRRLALEYYGRTEEYDRTFCTGPIVNGAIMPATPKERALINKNALAVRAELVEIVVRLGYTERDFQRALTRAHVELERR